MDQLKPLLYLELRQLINSIKNTARSPKRLIPMLIFGAWIFSSMIQSLLIMSGNISSNSPRFDLLQQININMIETGVFLFFAIGSVLVLYSAFSSGIMIFSLAHIDFLFPTPISRRSVLIVKLLRDYVKYGFYVAFFFMIIGSPIFGALHVSIIPWGFISIAAVLALLLFVVNLAHTINIVFTFGFERLKQAGLMIKAALVAALLVLIGYGIYQYITTGDSYASLLSAANSPIGNIIFAPAKWTAILFLAPLLGVTSDGWINLIMLWGLAAGSFLLLLSRRENIYEPSLGVSVKYAKKRQAMRSGDYSSVRISDLQEKGTRRASGFHVPPFGRGAVALVWKNLLLKYRVSRAQAALMIVMPLVAIYMVQRFVGPKDRFMLQYLPFGLLYIIWILSMTAQAEMRSELKQANILKSMPIAAWKVILAQNISAVAYLTAGVAAFAVSIWAFIPETRPDLLLLCSISAPFFAFANVSAMSISSILYPDMRDISQNYIFGMVGFLLIAIAALPTLVLGGILWGVFRLPWYITAACISVANIIVGAAGISIAGLLFRKFDPTGE